MRTNTRYKEIYAAIKQDIEAGVYPINQKLPQGRLLAEKISGQRTNHYKSLTFACARRLCCQTTWLGALFKTFKIEPLLNFLR
ncbi:hypothetical protein EfsSVR2332_25760 [Enterococcus faecalis]|uniref:Uncharacterized protein n=1 Tax=Enterococcus faecalis TaxID=1351 RepID=A0AC59HS23_ENTFL|nr:hypothetical protein EfsSVR2332_25760 [Enterococcus faecalis]